MPTILLVRHAQGSFGGPVYDVLSERGVRQARTVAADLVRRGVRADAVRSGALARQRDTAAAVAAAAGRPVEVDARWDEYAADDVLAHHSGAAVRLERGSAPAVGAREFQAILEDALRAWIGSGAGGPAAEPWPAFAARVAGALDDLAAALETGQTAVACTSGGVIATACARVLALPDEAVIALNRVAINTAVTKLVTGRRGMTLVSFNEHAHLPPDLLTYR